MRLDVAAIIAVVIAIWGGVWYGGHMDERIHSLESQASTQAQTVVGLAKDSAETATHLARVDEKLGGIQDDLSNLVGMVENWSIGPGDPPQGNPRPPAARPGVPFRKRL